jgi:ribosome-interacting GTPase 1
MPANLTPDFIKARERFRMARLPEEKLSALEEMLATIPKHKGTDKMQADIKRRIGKLRDAGDRSKTSHRPGLDHIPREGAGQIVLIGPPNGGKSSLLACLSNARPTIADHPFSTPTPVPGMIRFEDVPIQLVDLPPVTREYTEPWIYNLIRGSDLGLLVVEAGPRESIRESIDAIVRLLEERHIRLVKAATQEGDAHVKEISCRIVLTKCDRLEEDRFDLVHSLLFPAVATSAASGDGLDDLAAAVFDALRIIRVYTKVPGEKPDLTEPYTLPIGSTVLDAVRTVHRDFVERLRYVRIWGSGRFDGQKVPSDHRLKDGDVVEIHLQ